MSTITNGETQKAPGGSLREPDSNKAEQPIRFAGSELGEKRHICAFFDSSDEEYRVMLPFIKEGIDRGEKAFHVVNPSGAPIMCGSWNRWASM
jgi:hypothetical protein